MNTGSPIISNYEKSLSTCFSFYAFRTPISMQIIAIIENIVIIRYISLMVETYYIFLINIKGKIRKFTISFIEKLKFLYF